MSPKKDLNISIPSCPFCGGEAQAVVEQVRSGYGEYETANTYHSVKCTLCNSKGREYPQKPLVDFTKYTVADFRNNPILRAKVEDEYEAYCQQCKHQAIEAWSTRVDATKDAKEWGPALNAAGWEFQEAYYRHTKQHPPAIVFNNTKTILRDCLTVYFKTLFKDEVEKK
jgi:hypothetical protein